MDKFTPDQLKSMLTDEARVALPQNVEFGQTEDGKLTVDGRVIPYCELKQRDDAWYEKRAKFWIISEHVGGICGVGIWSKYHAPLGKWHGCYIPSKKKIIFFSPENPILSAATVEAEVRRWVNGFHSGESVSPGVIQFGSHQSRDIREAIDAEGPWEDEIEKSGDQPEPTDDQLKKFADVLAAGFANSGSVGEPGPVGVCGDGSPPSEPQKSETVKPETVDAIVAMYEERLQFQLIQNDMGAQETRRLIEAQSEQIRDLTARMQRIKDAIDGKPEKIALPVENDGEFNDPFGAAHDRAVQDAEKFSCRIHPTEIELQEEIKNLKESMGHGDGNF